MPINPPILVTRAHVGKGPGIVLLSFAAPAGELGKGSVDNVEVVRIAMTHSTFREFVGLFNCTLAELGMRPTSTPANEPTQRFQRRPRPVPVRPEHENEQS